MAISAQPLFDNAIIKRDVNTKTSTAGLVVVESGRDAETDTGVVLAIGPGRHNDVTGEFIPTTVKAGDRVAFAKVSAQTIKVDERPVIFIREVDVYAILREV